MSLKLVLLALAIAAISADYIPSVNYTCLDCKCAVDSNSIQFNYDDPIALCVHWIGCDSKIGSCNRVRSAHAIRVDDYAVVELKDGQNQFFTAQDAYKYDTVKIVLQAHGTFVSDPIDFVKFSGSTPTFYANVYSAVIGIHNGTVYNITWDNYCGTCEGTDKCTTINLSSEPARTTQICNNADKCRDKNIGAQCDPKIYISWIGSDKKNQKMTSAGMRLARFRNFDMEDAYIAAENLNSTTSSSSSSTKTPTTVTS